MLGRHTESQQLATEALRKADQDISAQYRSTCHFALAQSAKWQGNNKEAIRQFQLAAPYMLAHKNRKKAAALNQNLGLIYESEQLYPQAIAHFEATLRFDRLANSAPQEFAMDYQSLAGIYARQNRLPLALAYYKKSEPMLSPDTDIHQLTNLYGNLGNLYKEMAHLDSSLYYCVFRPK